MTKPKTLDGYSSPVTDACERVLVTLLRGIGPLKESVFLIGGLTPRYLIQARPPEVPRHAGTGDVDVVVELSILADAEAYRTLEDNLKTMGFDRAENERGQKQSWRWKAEFVGSTVFLEFLADDPALAGGRIQEIPSEGNVSALNIPHASLVFDLHQAVSITAELLGDNGQATETVRYADIVSFTCLKAFAFDQRAERKDAHDLVYCLQYAAGGPDAIIEAFRVALATKHRTTILEALNLLASRFCDDGDGEGEGYRKDGPVAVARFENDDSDNDGPEQRDSRILRQRQVSYLISRIILPLLSEQSA
jgi:hypothetical protein